MQKKWILVTLTLFSLYPLAYAADQTHPTENHWSYQGQTGPGTWGDLSKEYTTCKLGKHQSPIHIETATSSPLPKLVFDYQPIPLTIENNGHTIKVDAEKVGSLTLGEDTYQLKQVHFHSPAEEVIQKQHFDMVAHLVHQNTEGKLAVVAALFNKGNTSHPLIATLWDTLPTKEGDAQTHAQLKIDFTKLLPEDKNYYTYEGSLTTPPCSEGVKWLILKQTQTISSEQLAAYQALYPQSARPVQPLNDRTVFSSN